MRAHRNSLFVQVVLLVLAGLTGWINVAASQETPRPKTASPQVLVLMARNLSDPWVVAQVEGIQRVLDQKRPATTSAIEYLDWQTASAPGQEEKLAAYFGSKYRGADIRVVIAAEQAAIDFLIRQRDALFPKAQAVFCGVPRFDETRRPAWATGQLENRDPGGTFRLARQLQPGLKRFVILDDRAGSQEVVVRMITREVPDAEQHVKLEFRVAETIQEVYTEVEHLPPDAAVLLTKSRLAWHLMDELRLRCPVPIYGTRSPTQLAGILGGSLLDGELTGRSAGRLALRLLAGEKAVDIPFETDIPHRLVVDYTQLKRFGIPLSAVPPGCEVLNRVLTPWERHRKVLIASGAVIIVLGVLVVALFGLLRQKRAAAARLDRSLSVLSATFDSISDGVLVVDKEGRVTGHNERFLSLWGIPRQLAERRNDEELLKFVLDQLEDPEGFRTRVQELYSHPDESGSETIEFKDGRVFERDSRPQVQGGAIVGRVWSFRDITARRRVEEERERLTSQLAQAQKMDALGTLAGGIAHDFNNMLTGILGCAALARDRLPPTHPAAEDIHQVITSGERASELVRQILTFSRKRAPERKVVSIEPIVRDTMRLLRATAPAAIELAAELLPNVPPVFADAAQVHQALLNLCTNGVHAMGRGPGELRVVLECRAPDAEVRDANLDLPGGPLVCLSVRDTGHGMDPATLERVFEPFYTTKESGEGTGLGLAVVHGIVASHEGVITAHSEVGKGTVFTIYFPPATGRTTETPEEEEPLAGCGENILVVDDEAIVAEVAAAMLRRLGYRATTCTGGEQALELLRAEPDACSLVLTDLNMPKVGGLDLIRRLREQNSPIPCLIMTGYVSSGAIETEARALGVPPIIQKPFSERALGLAVASALGNARPAEVLD